MPIQEQISSSLASDAAVRRAGSWRRRLVWLATLVILGGSAYLAMQRLVGRPPESGRTGGGKDPRSQPARVAVAELGNLDLYLQALGSAVAPASVTLRPQVEGQLVRVLFQEGQDVREGQLLAEIDPRPFQARLAQAEGGLARDRAMLANAKIDLARYRDLVAQDSASKQQLDTQQALVRQYEGSVKAGEGGLAAAQLDLAYTQIVAPLSGRIGLRGVDAGNWVRPSDSQALAQILQTQPMDVLLALPQDQLPRVRAALAGGAQPVVEALGRDQRQRLAEGRLTALDNQIDATTGTFKLKARFLNQDQALFPNQFVNIRLLIERLEGVVSVPLGAIQRSSRGTFVHALDADNRTKAQLVTLGPSNDQRVVIRDGLEPGARVVIEGLDRLKDGTRVEPLAPEAQPGS